MSTNNTQPVVVEGNLVATGIKTAIVAARFNHFIVEKLVGGAIDAISRHGGDASQQSVIWVPGSWEIPLIAQKLAKSGKYDAVICLGAVIRGGTPHFDYVAAEVSKGVAQASWDSGVPISFGVLTTDSIEQCIERAGTKMGNKGFEAAVAAVEMVNVLRQIEGA